MVGAALHAARPGRRCRAPEAGSKPSTSVCGKRSRSRSIACSGRRVVGEGGLHPGALVGGERRVGEQVGSRVPRSRASGRGTGASTNSQAATPSRPRSTSQEPLRWAASEKE